MTVVSGSMITPGQVFPPAAIAAQPSMSVEREVGP